MDNVVSFVEKKAQKLTNWTPEQRLMIYCLQELLDDDERIAQALAGGISPEILFRTTAELAVTNGLLCR
jgi:hypothetical protein